MVVEINTDLIAVKMQMEHPDDLEALDKIFNSVYKHAKRHVEQKNPNADTTEILFEAARNQLPDDEY